MNGYDYLQYEVCTLDQAKELGQLGYKQETAWYWVKDNSKQPDCYMEPTTDGYRLLTVDMVKNIGFSESYAAPSGIELAKNLPIVTISAGDFINIVKNGDLKL